ncbi:GntR family transcriptional regulator [Streptomyces sp. NBC_00963]|uniref:GntR family transcriptional regulator n=1 Tax=unclassified Streptomyces TaxID=2593676 RepID=UPI0038701CD3|nr:GntR family transcriptional regulator [Streptomyces sp. NBC_00963]WSX70904.1 GntR family transcriptional regulator [Streptomyces sp. NBC_00932]
MARKRTQDLPDLSRLLLLPHDQRMVAMERSVLRHRSSTEVAVSLAEQIAARLACAITLDLIHAGQRLLEHDLCEVLGVSRAPVREALRILERDRLIEFQARRGALVTAPTPEEVRNVFDVRIALYVMLLREEMALEPKRLLAVLDAHMPAVERPVTESADDYATATFLMNSAITSAASNRTLADLLQSLAIQTLRYVRLGLAYHPENIPRSLDSWHALRTAVAAGEVAPVVRIAEERIERVRDAALTALGDSGPED